MEIPRSVARFTREIAPPLVPEVRLALADAITPVWTALETEVGRDAPPPYWAFAWPGGQALARLFLDRPELVRGQRVLDFGAGSGLVAIAALRAGAARAVAADVDAHAAAAALANAALNDVPLEIETRDLVGEPLAGFDLLAAGDMCYEQPLAGRITRWFTELARAGAFVLLADPGRTYAPRDGLVEIARYVVPTSLELEDRTARETVVWRIVPGA